ncbi:MAG: group III truncated hemoglobin [Chitinophagaceae bacterium]|nr:group III truncated hemoglobin [Chitinophagaceae bacterium]
MKKEIENREDVIALVNVFYEKVKKDGHISHFFTEVVKVNWESHLPVMYDFWENIIFHTGAYTGNPMQVHQHLHDQSPMLSTHFERWLALFNETVDELYTGEKAFLVKQRALSIATVMQIKIGNLSREESVY